MRPHVVLRFFSGIFCIIVVLASSYADAATRPDRLQQAKIQVNRVHVKPVAVKRTNHVRHVQRRVSPPPVNYDYTVIGLGGGEGDESSGSVGLAAAVIAREAVEYSDEFKPGTIVINTQERRLYLMLGNSQAMRYG